MRVAVALSFSLGLVSAPADAQQRLRSANMDFKFLEGPEPVNTATWLGVNDYPTGALLRNQQGIVGFEFTVGADGKVSACRVSQTSGFGALDKVPCRALNRRARFIPAKGPNGEPIASTGKATIKFTIGDDLILR